MAAVSEKQAAFLANLKRRFAASNTPGLVGEKDRAARCFQEIAFLQALPAPASSAEASEQINALQGVSLTSYAAVHRAWAEAVIAAMRTRVADPLALPTNNNGGQWTAAAWMAYVRAVLA